MKRFLSLAAFALLATGTLATSALAQRYREIIKDSPIVEIRGETADTTKLGSDRYVEDNIDYLLANHDWLAVNFSTYWCPDSRAFRPFYDSASALPKYHGIRWAYADIDGTVGNETFRKRFGLPGIPVVMLFHKGETVMAADSTRSVLDGHEGDKVMADLLAMLDRFYKPDSAK
ncbi:MAG: thioredoxin family protein [candidate division Zixibacteria bacterium]|nr:thioredoxin family protein [candidate division Zixibacteria bacterium]